ncbi:MAG: hypothetical protein HQK50_17655 [Oligoflexia bacterium]|nr:hypothetical protein [Oligoflexia bacterium]
MRKLFLCFQLILIFISFNNAVRADGEMLYIKKQFDDVKVEVYAGCNICSNLVVKIYDNYNLIHSFNTTYLPGNALSTALDQNGVYFYKFTKGTEAYILFLLRHKYHVIHLQRSGYHWMVDGDIGADLLCYGCGNNLYSSASFEPSDISTDTTEYVMIGFGVRGQENGCGIGLGFNNSNRTFFQRYPVPFCSPYHTK